MIETTDEWDAARAVQRVVGGTWEKVDTGAQSGMFDVLHVLDNGARIALEVTSDGSRFVTEASKALAKRTNRGDFDAPSLSFLWQIHVNASTRIDALDPIAIEEILRDFETRNVESVAARAYGEPDERAAWRVGIDSAVLWSRTPPLDHPRILAASSFNVIGEHTSLAEALQRVLAKADNQRKLAAADVDERHLYVYLEDRAAASGLRGIWPMPRCPADPCEVIDTIWMFARWASTGLVHRVAPGTDDWEHFVMATGEPAAEPDHFA